MISLKQRQQNIYQFQVKIQDLLHLSIDPLKTLKIIVRQRNEKAQTILTKTNSETVLSKKHSTSSNNNSKNNSNKKAKKSKKSADLYESSPSSEKNGKRTSVIQ